MKAYNIEELLTKATGCEHEDCSHQGFYVTGELSEDETEITGYISCGIHLEDFKELLFLHGIEPKERRIL